MRGCKGSKREQEGTPDATGIQEGKERERISTQKERVTHGGRRDGAYLLQATYGPTASQHASLVLARSRVSESDSAYRADWPTHLKLHFRQERSRPSREAKGSIRAPSYHGPSTRCTSGPASAGKSTKLRITGTERAMQTQVHLQVCTQLRDLRVSASYPSCMLDYKLYIWRYIHKIHKSKTLDAGEDGTPADVDAVKHCPGAGHTV